MDENKKNRIRLVDNSNLVWEQRRAREEKSVHSNTVQNDSLLHRSAKKAKEAEEKLYAEKTSRADNNSVQQRREVNREIREGMDVRNSLLRQEKSMGIEGAFSFDELKKAQNTPTLVGRSKPVKIRKKDVKGLEGKTARKKRSKVKMLPSERKSRLNRAKIERNRKKFRERLAKKELTITDSKGQKISVERLRKLRGLSTDRAVTKKDTDFAKKYANAKAKQPKTNSGRPLRRRDENTR